MLAKQLPRIFIHKVKDKDISLADPQIQLSPDAVLNFYSRTYADLLNARVEGPFIEDDAVKYKFVSTIGTKG